MALRSLPALAALLRAAAGGEGEWILADEGQDCSAACARHGRQCSEDHWPSSAQELSQIAADLKQPCLDVQRGDVNYDPSREGSYCGWHGDMMGLKVDGPETTRCGALPPWSTQRFCYCEGVLVTTTLPFDCLKGLSEDVGAGWPADKRQWCCRNQGLGCTTTSPPFDCHLSSVGWSSEKSLWCCQQTGRGCVTSSSTRTYTTTTASDPFDCGTDFGNWMKAWSAPKKIWCCQHRKLGCMKVEVATTSSKPFECASDDSTWGPTKKEWCCSHENQGCPPSPVAAAVATDVGADGKADFDCQVGYKLWQTGWSDAKKKWCCDNRGLGCQFNCVAGYTNWKTGWSADKKKWCCKHQKLGCGSVSV